ncbi:MAG TPA: PAS domain-containing protein [Sphingomicrobium sp.]|nr:PAS domain-containing protein [Sphingomicrobium sp.]
MLARDDPEELLNAALSALATGSECRATLDEMAVPIYTTDTEGRVTYWNRACVDFAGRQPKLGADRWCVTWQLFTSTGEPLRHEDCPMAEAIRQRKPIRDLIAIAERPDRSRVAFRAYPTPVFDDEGRMTAAINMLIDVTAEQSAALTEQAERCRRLAEATYDRSTCKVLVEMAKHLDETARNFRTIDG